MIWGDRGGDGENELTFLAEQFWSPGNLELFVLCPPPVHPKKKRELSLSLAVTDVSGLTFSSPPAHDEQLFVIPFAKSAVTAVHTPVRSRTLVALHTQRLTFFSLDRTTRSTPSCKWTTGCSFTVAPTSPT